MNASLRKHPYVACCAAAIALWLVAWLLATPNLYGWLVDDSDTFSRFQRYASGGSHLYDIPWFHAYMWFVAFLPWQLHWAIPSHIAPRAWEATAQFRAFIVYSMCLHAIVLALIACLLRQLCSNTWVAGGAFFLILTSPTLALYTPLLDSRYLGFLAALPAIILLVRGARTAQRNMPPREYFFYYYVPGFLLGVGEDIHYECLYLVVPFALVYWSLRIFSRGRIGSERRALLSFVAGLLSWIVPVQTISAFYGPFPTTYVGMMFAQYSHQIPPYTRLESLSTWFAVYRSEMGLPMMSMVAVGSVMLALERFRPPYVRAFDARTIVGVIVAFSVYLLLSPTHVFYRMSFGIQIFYALGAAITIERLAHSAPSLRGYRAFAVAALLWAFVAFVPSFTRTPEVYAAQQGLGKAINLAYERGHSQHVRFISTFDYDYRPEGIITREQFDTMPAADYLVTYFPLTFHFKYPDLLALLADTQPVASYPTLWCTKEMWAQVPTFFGSRRFTDEPENCQARVYRVADIRQAARGRRLSITSIRADSTALPTLGARRVMAIREPSAAWAGSELWNVYWDLWVSQALPGKHWLDLTFAEPALISKITFVPPEFRVPPDFLWHGRRRVENVEVWGAKRSERLRLLWSGHGLQERVVFSATFPAATLSRFHVVLWQSAGHNPAVGLRYIRFPGYRQETAWQNADTPGHPPPGHDPYIGGLSAAR